MLIRRFPPPLTLVVRRQEGARLDLAAIHPTMPYWDALDRLHLQGELRRWLDGEPGASIWPWESDNPEIAAVWERFTRPENLAALEDWGRDMREWGGLAASCTLMAIETCRLRSDGAAVRPVADCTPEALAGIRLRHPGAEFPPRLRTIG